MQSVGGIDAATPTMSRWAVLMVPDEACVVLDDGTLKRPLGYCEPRWVMQTNLVREERVDLNTIAAVFCVLPVGSLGPLAGHGEDYRLLVGDVQINPGKNGPSLSRILANDF